MKPRSISSYESNIRKREWCGGGGVMNRARNPNYLKYRFEIFILTKFKIICKKTDEYKF